MFNIATGIMRHCKKNRESYFQDYAHATHTVQEGKYIYLPRGGNVLAIAHLDFVCEPNSYAHRAGSKITSIALDDRLGVYILLELLPSLGVEGYDILLTENEEIGMSTAAYFETSVKYNWMFQFDRRGINSSVLYQYDTQETRDKLNKHGIKVELGSYSDISCLERLGIVGINFACGYSNEHSYSCAAYVPNVLSCINKFRSFYTEYKDVAMPIEENWSNWDNWDNWEDTEKPCWACGLTFDSYDIDNNGLCYDCEKSLTQYL